MTILVTSGGTIVKIDDVRHIANFSSGEFLSHIAEEALVAGHNVIYLHAKGAKKPFGSEFIFDPSLPVYQQFSRIAEAQKSFLEIKSRLKHKEFKTFDEYSKALKHILSTKNIDIVFLGAAVSDYGMKPHQGKISSAKDALTLKLVHNPKIIREVKGWSKKHVFQVGFKLLSGADRQILIETAYKSGLDNKSDLTIANDLKSIRSGKRGVFVITPEKGVLNVSGEDSAKKVVDFVLRRAKIDHFRTVTTVDDKLSEIYKKEFLQLKLLCNILYKKGLMTPFYKGSPMSHGSIALKIDGGFLITSRGSNKEKLGFDDIVLVSKIDWKKRMIHIKSSSQKKASLNTPLVGKIFNSFPQMNAVVHTHSFDHVSPTTNFAETPGTLQYALGPLRLLKKSPVVNLKNHGLISVGENLIQALERVLKQEIIQGNCYTEFPELYDLLYKRYLITIPDFVKLVARNTLKNSHILDLAAGTGEVTIPLLKKGFKVSSIDQSMGMLKQLRKKAGKEFGNNLETYIRDINHFDFSGRFDAVCIRQAVNYFTCQASLQRGFKKIHKLLNKGGTFIFNAPNFKASTKSYVTANSSYEVKDLSICIVESNVLKNRRLIHKQEALVWDKGIKPKIIRDLNEFHMYTKKEFEFALRKAGFRKIRFLASGLRRYNKDDKTLYCVATK